MYIQPVPFCKDVKPFDMGFHEFSLETQAHQGSILCPVIISGKKYINLPLCLLKHDLGCLIEKSVVFKNLFFDAITPLSTIGGCLNILLNTYTLFLKIKKV